MKYLEYDPHFRPSYGLPVVKRPCRSEEQAYISRMAKTLVGSLGVDEATACAKRHHWLGLLPFVSARVGAMCLDR